MQLGEAAIPSVLPESHAPIAEEKRTSLDLGDFQGRIELYGVITPEKVRVLIMALEIQVGFALLGRSEETATLLSVK